MSDLLTVHVGDANAGLAKIESGSCQCCVTSPPYWGLRNYQVDGQIGMESTMEKYTANIVAVMSNVKAALKDDGLLWLNLGDSHCSTAPGTRSAPLNQQGILASVRDATANARIRTRPETPSGLKQKDLMMIPSRVALDMQKDGWFLRSMIPWIKRNCMPESVTDRPSTAVEYVFLFSKQEKYYYDHNAVKLPYSESTMREARDGYDGYAVKEYDGTGAQDPSDTKRRIIESVRNKQRPKPDSFHNKGEYVASEIGRNRRNSDWFFESWQGMVPDDDGDPMALVVNTHGFKGAHFATFPERLVQPMILASTKPGDIVLDPFAGAFTTALVSLKLGRRAIALELNPEFAKLGEQRCSNHLMIPLL